MSDHRPLTVTQALRTGNKIHIHFEEAFVSLQANEDWLRQHGINPQDIIPGITLLIQGKSGNTFIDFWKPNALESIKIANG